MGKSGKLFKTLLVGVKAFKSLSKEKVTKDPTATNATKKEEKVQSRKGSKDKCMWSLGKSSSRNRDCPVRSPSSASDMAETNTAQLEEQQCNIVQPAILPLVTAPVHDSQTPSLPADTVIIVGNCCSKAVPREGLTEGWDESKQEEWAAAKIQATFRSYLAQRAFRALKALVRLQALARGRIVRRQAAATLRCIQALVRVQAHVRARQVRMSEIGQLVQRHLQQTKQQKRNSTEGWVNSTATLLELQAKAQSKQGVMRRQHALVYAFSEQLCRFAPKKSSPLVIDCQPDKDHWGWIWLERWTAARSWDHFSSMAKEQVAKNDENMKSNMDTEKCEGALRKESFFCIEFPTEYVNLQTKVAGKQMSVFNCDVLSSNDLLGDDNKVKANVEGEDQLCALKNKIVSCRDKAVDVTEPLSLSPPASPTIPSFRKGTPCASQLQRVSPPPPPPLPSFGTAIPCATQPIISRNAMTPSGASLVASAVVSPTAMDVAQLTAVATSPGASVTLDTQQTQVDTQQTQVDSPARLSVSNPASSSSISPVESCSLLQPVSPFTMLSAEQRSLQQHHIIPPPPLQIPDPTLEETLNDVLTPEEDMPGRNVGSNSPMNGAKEEIDPTDGDPQTFKNGNDTVQAEVHSERTGKISSCVVAASSKVTEASTKRNNVTGTKHEQGECVSPSLPNYMATTLSSKAKARCCNSPKQSDAISPSSKRRHSLSGSEGKISPVLHRHISHVRAGSKGHLTSLRDGSGENSPHANGDSRRHGK